MYSLNILQRNLYKTAPRVVVALLPEQPFRHSITIDLLQEYNTAFLPETLMCANHRMYVYIKKESQIKLNPSPLATAAMLKFGLVQSSASYEMINPIETTQVYILYPTSCSLKRFLDSLLPETINKLHLPSLFIFGKETLGDITKLN